MQPSELQPKDFRDYPPQARGLAVQSVAAFRRLPLAFLPNFLRELIQYDYQFPAEQRALEAELKNLASLSPQEAEQWFADFARIRLSPELETEDWAAEPAKWVEDFSAYLWASRQLDAFRGAALAYGQRLAGILPPEKPAVPRLGIAVIGQGVESYSGELFRKLRPHGTYFSQVKPEGGLSALLQTVTLRAQAHPLPYAHWYIDGGEASPHDGALTSVSWEALRSARAKLLARIQREINSPGMGPEALRSYLARMRPSEIGLDDSAEPVLANFQLKILTEGSGTQIFSTTFAQWTAREAIRRAQPVTMLVRFAPRQRQKPMNELLSPHQEPPQLDPLGSLVDADIGAYYSWLNLRRLSGADQSAFLVWHENQSRAIAIGPDMPQGTSSTTAATLPQILSWMS